MSFRVFVYNQSIFRSYRRSFPHTPILYCPHVHHFRHLKDVINETLSWLAGSAHIDLISHYFHCLMCKWVADSSHNATSHRVPLTPQSETMTWAQRGVDPVCPPPLNMTRHFWLLCFKKKTHRRKMRDGTLQIGSDSSYTFLFNEIFMKWSLWQFFSQRLKISPSLIPQWAVTVIIRYRVCRLKKVSGV